VGKVRATKTRQHARVAIALLLSSGILSATGCLFLSADKRALIALKNRSAIPAPADFDPAVSLAAMLAPGNDRHRWSERKAGVVEGYVVAVKQAGIELANGLSFTRRDLHIDVALRPDAPPRERVVVEVTPPIRSWARQRGRDWSASALEREVLHRRCRFEGWLLFDTEHVDEAENTHPGNADNWRATAWELHPVTAIDCHHQ
jgi:hypothetical protein